MKPWCLKVGLRAETFIEPYRLDLIHTTWFLKPTLDAQQIILNGSILKCLIQKRTSNIHSILQILSSQIRCSATGWNHWYIRRNRLNLPKLVGCEQGTILCIIRHQLNKRFWMKELSLLSYHKLNKKTQLQIESSPFIHSLLRLHFSTTKMRYILPIAIPIHILTV